MEGWRWGRGREEVVTRRGRNRVGEEEKGASREQRGARRRYERDPCPLLSSALPSGSGRMDGWHERCCLAKGRLGGEGHTREQRAGLREMAASATAQALVLGPDGQPLQSYRRGLGAARLRFADGLQRRLHSPRQRRPGPSARRRTLAHMPSAPGPRRAWRALQAQPFSTRLSSRPPIICPLLLSSQPRQCLALPLPRQPDGGCCEMMLLMRCFARRSVRLAGPACSGIS